MTATQILSQISFENAQENLVNVREIQRNTPKLKQKLDKTKKVHFVTNRNKIEYVIMSPKLLKEILSILRNIKYAEILEKVIKERKTSKEIKAKNMWKKLGV